MGLRWSLIKWDIPAAEDHNLFLVFVVVWNCCPCSLNWTWICGCSWKRFGTLWKWLSCELDLNLFWTSLELIFLFGPSVAARPFVLLCFLGACHVVARPVGSSHCGSLGNACGFLVLFPEDGDDDAPNRPQYTAFEKIYKKLWNTNLLGGTDFLYESTRPRSDTPRPLCISFQGKRTMQRAPSLPTLLQEVMCLTWQQFVEALEKDCCQTRLGLLEISFHSLLEMPRAQLPRYGWSPRKFWSGTSEKLLGLRKLKKPTFQRWTQTGKHRFKLLVSTCLWVFGILVLDDPNFGGLRFPWTPAVT